VDVEARVQAEKGSGLTEREHEILDERVDAARGWLASYAPERARVTVRRDTVPGEATQLDESQRAYLLALADSATGSTSAAGDEWQNTIFDVANAHGVEAKAAFAALYLAFLGRPNGPRAGWLLASLDRDFVIERLRQAGAAG
jgi:lysyl-tRNA synthetase class 1